MTGVTSYTQLEQLAQLEQGQLQGQLQGQGQAAAIPTYTLDALGDLQEVL
jgi:hypothetical protein